MAERSVARVRGIQATSATRPDDTGVRGRSTLGLGKGVIYQRALDAVGAGSLEARRIKQVRLVDRAEDQTSQTRRCESTSLTCLKSGRGATPTTADPIEMASPGSTGSSSAVQRHRARKHTGR